MDIIILKKLNSLTEDLFFARLSESLGTYLLIAMMLGFFVFFLMSVKEERQKGLKIFFQASLAALLARYVVTEIIRFFYNRSRPFETIEGIRQVLNHSAGGSFPSGHAVFAFAFSTIVYINNRRLGILFFILSFLVGAGRVMGGVHYPTDVLGGAAIGVVAALLLKKIYGVFANRNKK